jgi:hypothetical protein
VVGIEVVQVLYLSVKDFLSCLSPQSQVVYHFNANYLVSMDVLAEIDDTGESTPQL